MYQALTFYHSLTRWLVLLCLIYAVFSAAKGLITKATFSKIDNAVRHWTATIVHIQLVIGMLLYFKSPITQYFRTHFNEAIQTLDTTFFGLMHPILMLISIVVLTIGSALTKRRLTDTAKFRTQLLWFSAALLIILISIPWPFSPLASRPYYR